VKLLEAQLADASKKIAELGTQLVEAQGRAADADKEHQVNDGIFVVCDVG